MHDLPIIKKADLVLDSKSRIGEGQFGTVYKAKWRGQTVAVKVLNSKSANLEAFYKEAQIMAKVGNHQNIVRLMGVCMDDDAASIVSQFYPQGSCYKVFLKDRREVTWLQLLKVVKGAAAGVMHLHAENYIHRDIASRNILISDSFEGVVTDFGMSRLQLREGSQTVTYLGPVKWMAPESIRDHVVSKATDVYMFGSFMWELLTREIPYCDDDPLVAATRVMEQGCTLPMPQNCPDTYRSLMIQCLKTDPDQRPTFVEIFQRLEQMYDDAEGDSQRIAPISSIPSRASQSSPSLQDSSPILDLSQISLSLAGSSSNGSNRASPSLPPPSRPMSATRNSSSPQRARYSSDSVGYMDSMKLPMTTSSGSTTSTTSGDSNYVMPLLQTSSYAKRFTINSNGYLVTTSPYSPANDYCMVAPLPSSPSPGTVPSADSSPRINSHARPPFAAATATETPPPTATKITHRRISEGSGLPHMTPLSSPIATTTITSNTHAGLVSPQPIASGPLRASPNHPPTKSPPSSVGRSFAVSASSQDILRNTKESPHKMNITLYSDRVQHSPELLGWVPQASLEHSFKRPALSRSGPANLTLHSHMPAGVPDGSHRHHHMSSSGPAPMPNHSHSQPLPHNHFNNAYAPPHGGYTGPMRGGLSSSFGGPLHPIPQGYPPRGGLAYAPPHRHPLAASSSGTSMPTAGYPPPGLFNAPPHGFPPSAPLYSPSASPTSPSSAPVAFGYAPMPTFPPSHSGRMSYPAGYPPTQAPMPPPLSASSSYYMGPMPHSNPSSLASSSSSVPPGPPSPAPPSAAPAPYLATSKPYVPQPTVAHPQQAMTHTQQSPVSVPQPSPVPIGTTYNKPLPVVPAPGPYSKPLPALPGRK